MTYTLTILLRTCQKCLDTRNYMGKLDDLSWHVGCGEFPEGVPEQNGATHIGFFTAWVISRGLWGNSVSSGSADFVEAVRHRNLSGTRFLIDHCDGKLFSEMLTPDGAAFAQSYYNGHYFKDYCALLTQGSVSDYLVEDSWANYDRIATCISERHHAWRNKPWWKLW